MAKCHPPRNDVGSLVLNHSSSCHHHRHNHHHYRRWNSFSLRKLIAATISCGGGYSKSKNPNDQKAEIKEPDPDSKSYDGFTRPESGKLLDLLNLSSSSCDSIRREKVEEEDVEEVRRKEERLEELRMSVRLLQSENNEERENGAVFVRSFAKEDSDARSTLAMLGAIPPLVAMLDDDDDGGGSLIQALYALLNLGIGNDL